MSAESVLVIGGGIAGLFAACLCARRGHPTQLLSYGQGALAVAGGIIDVLGYNHQGQAVDDPCAHIPDLPADHPYSQIGVLQVERALEAFKELCSSFGYAYCGDAHHNQQVPTAIGSFKPSCLTPRTIDCQALAQAQRLCVVGFDLLKDFYPELIVDSLRHTCSPQREIMSCHVQLALPSGVGYRDVSALDIARLLENPASLRQVCQQLQGYADEGLAFLLPPVLGERPDYAVYDELHGALGTPLIEVSAIPPSVTGLRTENLLIAAARQLGVEFIEKARAVDSIVQGGHCTGVITQGADRRRTYRAQHFILATGGVFGGGLIAGMGTLQEPIFKLDISVPADQQQWSWPQLFAGRPQRFATYGVAVNSALQPLGPHGEVQVDNLHIAGRSLAGYDFCFEKSGNGVAIASAYHAACSLEEA